ncbi:kinase-like protein, partial [Exidia glandulosa HHB12029]
EFTVWREISHENLLPLIGLYVGIGKLPAMVSPWCNHGDINAYIASIQAEWHDKALLLIQVLQGLQYLHEYLPIIVHGDIKGANILVSDQGVARLSDFGFASVLAELSISMTTHTSVKGTLRWMAPELFTSENTSHTTQTDMWAFGCVMLEVFSDLLPYRTLRNDQAVVLAISRSERPASKSDLIPDTPDIVWSVMNDCWARKPWARPSV